MELFLKQFSREIHTAFCRNDGRLKGTVKQNSTRTCLAAVFGDHLDNARGEAVTIEQDSQELIVVLTKGTQREFFNLATLIALARKAQ